MKAILVIDLPVSCTACPITSICATDGRKALEIVRGGGTKKRMDYCPLRPLPREWTMDEVEPCAYNEGFVDGLNHCIYLITGETE